ncbi:MAG TPA: efflux RND transporter periplasmic adaptor subunit [Gemmatimonadales bacterium]
MVLTLSGGSALFGFRWFLVLAAVGCTARTAGGPPRVPVSVARVEVRSVPYEIAATGAVEPIRSVNVTSQVSGMLRRVRFTEGDEVTRGQVLLEIDRRPYLAALQQAEANLSRDVAQAENAARDAERYRVLARDRSVTEEDYQQKQATADALRATVRADSGALTVALLNLEYATIRAPIAGRTGSLLVREGNLVRANESATLVTINQLRPIVVRFAVPAAELPELQRRLGGSGGGQLRVIAVPAHDSAAALEGELSFVDNHVDSTTGTVLLKARFPNRDGRLWPGEFVDVTLVLGVQAEALVIPAQAVLAGQQGSYVFVVEADGTARQRPVTVQRTVDGLAVLEDPLEPGTIVVTDGQLRVTPGAKVDVRTASGTEDTVGGQP